MKPLFSIIIPHKNIPDLLMRCLESIPVTEDIQVIVVDDNSLDADTYLERYPELSRPYLDFICSTKGGGAGYARNIGLDYAKGKWLLFADADDLFVEDMYNIIKPYAMSEVDMIFFKEKSVLSSDINQSTKRAEYVNKFIDDFFRNGDETYIRLHCPQPWAKIIRREFVDYHQFRFDEVEFSNDYYFSVCTGYYAKQIKVVDRILYIYTFRKDSLSGTLLCKPNELKVRAEVSFRVEKLFRQLNINIEQRRPFKWYLWRMIHQDRGLFRSYFYKLTEIYPSFPTAIYSIGKGKDIKYRIKLYLYSLWLWIFKFIS